MAQIQLLHQIRPKLGSGADQDFSLFSAYLNFKFIINITDIGLKVGFGLVVVGRGYCCQKTWNRFDCKLYFAGPLLIQKRCFLRISFLKSLLGILSIFEYASSDPCILQIAYCLVKHL
jgi:hypothetical protein